MRLVISQPMFLPWRGMFEQMRLADHFVFYDDVQLPLGGGKGRGFITRVQIKGSKGPVWLSLPVKRAGEGKQIILDARLTDDKWRGTHRSIISQCYRDAPHYRWAKEHVVDPVYEVQTDRLSEVCARSMVLLASLLQVSPKISFSSELRVPQNDNASARVLDLCRKLGAKEYISGLGAMDYLDYELFEQQGVRVCFMDYALSPYPQLYGVFTPYVSVLDLFCNIGAEAFRSLGSRAVYWRDWPVKRADGRPARA